MFPDGVKSYQMKAELFASESVAEKAPMNGHKLGAQTLTFTSTQTEMAVHITEASNKRLYQKGETITVDVATANVSGMYDLVVQLQQKDQSGSYVDTLYQYANPSAGRYAFTLTGMAAGSYRIHAMIVRDDGYTVLHTSYFFIVQ